MGTWGGDGICLLKATSVQVTHCLSSSPTKFYIVSDVLTIKYITYFEKHYINYSPNHFGKHCFLPIGSFKNVVSVSPWQRHRSADTLLASLLRTPGCRELGGSGPPAPSMPVAALI